MTRAFAVFILLVVLTVVAGLPTSEQTPDVFDKIVARLYTLEQKINHYREALLSRERAKKTASAESSLLLPSSPSSKLQSDAESARQKRFAFPSFQFVGGNNAAHNTLEGGAVAASVGSGSNGQMGAGSLAGAKAGRFQVLMGGFSGPYMSTPGFMIGR